MRDKSRGMGRTGSGSGTEQAGSEGRALSHDLVCILEGFLSRQVEVDSIRGELRWEQREQYRWQRWEEGR